MASGNVSLVCDKVGKLALTRVLRPIVGIARSKIVAVVSNCPSTTRALSGSHAVTETL